MAISTTLETISRDPDRNERRNPLPMITSSSAPKLLPYLDHGHGVRSVLPVHQRPIGSSLSSILYPILRKLRRRDVGPHPAPGGSICMAGRWAHDQVELFYETLSVPPRREGPD